ncbi:unnamed protein product [Dicrocoelium dendriticum]|nr:unnamed protein product [Dicrocoelium dendriticum]
MDTPSGVAGPVTNISYARILFPYLTYDYSDRSRSANLIRHSDGRHQYDPFNQLKFPSSSSNCATGKRRSPAKQDPYFDLWPSVGSGNTASGSGARTEKSKPTYASVLTRKPSYPNSTLCGFPAVSHLVFGKSNTTETRLSSQLLNRNAIDAGFPSKLPNSHPRTHKQFDTQTSSEVRQIESNFRKMELKQPSAPLRNARVDCTNSSYDRPRLTSSKDLHSKCPSRWSESASCVHSTNAGKFLTDFKASDFSEIIPFSEFNPLVCATPKVKRHQPGYSEPQLAHRSLSLSDCRSFTDSSDTSVNVKKFNAPLLISIDDMIGSKAESCSTNVHASGGLNFKLKLDAIRETGRIGKVRELPKTKRPSRLKRTLLDERATRKNRSHSAPAICGKTIVESNVSVREKEETEVPVSLHETDATQVSANIVPDCNLVRASPQEESLISNLLSQLAQFQDRAFVKFANSPLKRSRSRRFVCGVREVIKHLRLKHVRLVILARDLEGGAVRRCEQLNTSEPLSVENNHLPILERIIIQIWELARATDPPASILIAHNRHKLAHLCHKPGRVCVIGVISFAGAEQTGDELLSIRSAVRFSSTHTEQNENSKANAGGAG